MATAPPPPPPPTVPREPGEPSNRWPWVALALGVLVIVVAVAFFFINRQRAVNVNIAGPPTVNAVAAGTASPGPPPTLVPPTLPPSATLAPTATVAPSPTPVPAPTQPPASPTPLPAPTQPPAAQAALPQPTTPPASQPTQPAQPTQPTQPTQPAAASTAAPAAAPTPPPAAPSPTAFAGQVAGGGGFGNSRADLDAAYGPPAGETPEHLVVYRKGNFEYHVGLLPDPNGRAALLVGISQPTTQAFTLEQATAEAHRLLPRDAQPPNPQQEGNPQFVVERYTSQLLAQALPADAFKGGQPGQFLAVYVRDPAQATRITRFIIGPGNDPNALVSQGR